MCGRVVWVWDAKTQRLIRKIDERALDDPERAHVLEKMRYNVPRSAHLPVIDGRVPDVPSIEIARWGFPIPARPNGVFNTRIETAAEARMWAGLLGKNHCVWPVKGFYEWQKVGERKVPHFIQRKDAQPMLIAGLIADRRVHDKVEACGSMITCAANEFMAPLHDRMPAIIEANQIDDWLHAKGQDIFALASPAGDVLMAHPVTPDVGDTKNDEPRLMEAMQGLSAFGDP